MRQSLLIFEQTGNSHANGGKEKNKRRRSVSNKDFEELFSLSDEAFVRVMLNVIMTGELHYTCRVLVPLQPSLTHSRTSCT